MRKNNRDVILGDGFSPIRFWVFNTIMLVVYLSFRLMMIYACIGANAIILTGTEEVANSSLGMLGIAFVNLMYGVSILVVSLFINSVWLLGNVYIIRKELYEFFERKLRWRDL